MHRRGGDLPRVDRGAERKETSATGYRWAGWGVASAGEKRVGPGLCGSTGPSSVWGKQEEGGTRLRRVMGNGGMTGERSRRAREAREAGSPTDGSKIRRENRKISREAGGYAMLKTKKVTKGMQIYISVGCQRKGYLQRGGGRAAPIHRNSDNAESTCDGSH